MALVCLQLISSQLLLDQPVPFLKSDQPHTNSIYSILYIFIQSKYKTETILTLPLFVNGTYPWYREIFAAVTKSENIWRKEEFSWCQNCRLTDGRRKGEGELPLSYREPARVFVQNFFLIGTSPLNLYAPHLCFTPPRLFTSFRDDSDAEEQLFTLWLGELFTW